MQFVMHLFTNGLIDSEFSKCHKQQDGSNICKNTTAWYNINGGCCSGNKDDLSQDHAQKISADRKRRMQVQMITVDFLEQHALQITLVALLEFSDEQFLMQTNKMTDDMVMQVMLTKENNPQSLRST